MNELLTKIGLILKHPATSLSAAVVGLGSMGTLATALGQTCSQLAHVRGLPAHLAAQLDTLGVTALAISSCAIIICTNAHSVSNSINISSGPPPEGQPNVLPFAPSGVSPQSLPLTSEQQNRAA